MGAHPRSIRARRHNGLHGSTAMAQQAMEQIIRSDSTTELSKVQATLARGYLDRLRESLKVRVDPETEVG